jgi:RNA polymerase sigma-70 factor (ECF subfamily)
MRRVYDLAYGFVNDHDDAEDVAQEAFAKVHNSLKDFRLESEFSTWLYRITSNCALDRLKQKKRFIARFVPIEDSLVNGIEVNHGMDQKEDSLLIERSLHELPTLQRAVVMLRHIDGFSTRQVSEMLKCSEGTVKTHLHRGLKKMRKMLEHLKDENS